MTVGQRDVTAAPVVVGVDGSEGSQRALRWAAEYARMSGAPLRAVMAWDLPTNYGMPANYDDVDFTKEAEARLEQTLAAVGDLGVVEQRVEQGHPAAGRTGLSLGTCPAAGHRFPRPRRLRRIAARIGQPQMHPSCPMPGRRRQGKVQHLTTAGESSRAPTVGGQRL